LLRPIQPGPAAHLAGHGWVCERSGARTELGGQPRTTWPDGVAETVAWYGREGWL
jgi:nucleoside-diphosphate-sugar epimerase